MGNSSGPCGPSPGTGTGTGTGQSQQLSGLAGVASLWPEASTAQADRCTELLSTGARSGCNSNTRHGGHGAVLTPRHGTPTQPRWRNQTLTARLQGHCSHPGSSVTPLGGGCQQHRAPHIRQHLSVLSWLSPVVPPAPPALSPVQHPAPVSPGQQHRPGATAASGGTPHFCCAPSLSREPFPSDALLKPPRAIAHGRRDGRRRISPDEYFRP